MDTNCDRRRETGRRLPRGAALAAWLMLSVAAPAAAGVPAVDSLVIVQSPAAWTLEIPYEGPWRALLIEGPPRLVIDLQEAHSRLPGAPGLCSVPIEDGPVEMLRTSQFRNRPGEQIMRVTLVLRAPLTYVAQQDPGCLRVILALPDSAAASPWRAALAQGVSPPVRLPPVQPTGAPAAATPEPLELAAARPSPAVAVLPSRADPTVEAEDSLALARLETLLADTTLFQPGRVRLRDAWETAGTRIVEDAQTRFLEGDTTGAIEQLLACERFYADTDAGQQATLLRTLLMESSGRVIEAGLGPPAPEAGPWPLLWPPVLARLCREALARGQTPLAERVLTVWRARDPEASDWASAAFALAESYLDLRAPERAAVWAARARSAAPEREVPPATRLLLARVAAARGEPAAAESLLVSAERAASGALRWRARAQRADLLYRQGRFAEAHALYESLAGAEVPRVERDWACYQLGNCCAALEDHAAAAAWLRQVGAEESNFWAPQARLRLAELLEVRHVAQRD